MPAPAYKWTVMLGAGSPHPSRFAVEAAYPVVEDGHMVLKDADHKPVFMAGPGLGCTFERHGRVSGEDAETAGPAPAAGCCCGEGAARSGCA